MRNLVFFIKYFRPPISALWVQAGDDNSGGIVARMECEARNPGKLKPALRFAPYNLLAYSSKI
jgi:hypothetical protein